MTKELEALTDIELSIDTKLIELPLVRRDIQTLKRALERNVPMKPHYEGDGYYNGNMVYDIAHCPCCNKVIEEDDDGWKEPYCCHCGQALDWSDVE